MRNQVPEEEHQHEEGAEQCCRRSREAPTSEGQPTAGSASSKEGGRRGIHLHRATADHGHHPRWPAASATRNRRGTADQVSLLLACSDAQQQPSEAAGRGGRRERGGWGRRRASGRGEPTRPRSGSPRLRRAQPAAAASVARGPLPPQLDLLCADSRLPPGHRALPQHRRSKLTCRHPIQGPTAAIRQRGLCPPASSGDGEGEKRSGWG
jgi:hypothetical protein